MAEVNDRLIVVLEAKIDKLESGIDKAIAKIANGSKQLSKHANDMDSTWAKLFGKYDPGEAIEKTFSRARFGLIEEGGAKIGLFGSALEALGPAGIAGAAGLAAFGAALEVAKGAAEYAEQISNTASKLGVTTKALQEYQYVAVASGVSTDALREALQAGNEKLGEFQSNIGSAKVKKVFEALGITQAEASQARNITDLLPEIAAKFQGLSAAEQAAIAKRAGLDGLLPILQKGPEAIRELQAEAEKSGAVLDTALIQKGKEAAEVLKEAGTAVDINLKRAFIGLAPVIADCLKIVAQLAKGIADAVEALGPIASFSRVHVQDAQKDVQTGLGNAGAAVRFFGGRIDPRTGLAAGGGLTGGLGADALYNNLKRQQDQLTARGRELDQIDAAAAAKTRVGTSNPLVADKAKKGPSDQTGDFDKAARDAADDAGKAVAQALAALTQNIQARAQAEKAAVDIETDKKLKDLAAEEVRVRAAKNDAHKADQLALIQAAQVDTLTAAAARKDLIDRQADQAQDLADLQFDQQQDQYANQIKTARASLASTAQQRAALELDVFRDEQQNAYSLRFLQNRQKVQNGQLTQDESDRDLRGLRSSQNAELVSRRVQAQRTASSLYAYANPTDGVGDQIQTAEVQALQQFNDGLATAILQSKSLGDVFHSVAQGIIADLLKIAIQREITQPLANLLFRAQGGGLGDINNTGGSVVIGDILSAIPHLATGSDYTSGGPTLVGERGPELLNLPRGGQVVPNALLDRISRMSPASLGARSTTVNHSIRIDLTGANGDETIRQIANAAAYAGTVQAIATSRSDQARAAQAQRNSAAGF